MRTKDLLDVIVGDLLPLGEVCPCLYLTFDHGSIPRLELLLFLSAKRFVLLAHLFSQLFDLVL